MFTSTNGFRGKCVCLQHRSHYIKRVTNKPKLKIAYGKQIHENGNCTYHSPCGLNDILATVVRKKYELYFFLDFLVNICILL